MASPTVESIYPSDSSTGVPTGADILITFDSEIDSERAKSNILITGPDFDQTSGPDGLLWLDIEKNYNPYFLQSPGYKGDLQGKFFFELLTTDNVIFSGLDYFSGSPNYKTRVKFVPDKPLVPNTTYTVYLLGDPDTTDTITRGISSRTVYSPQLGANTGSGSLVARGGYKGTIEDSIVVNITVAGNIKTAEYEWYYASTPSLIYTGITSTKYRSLIDSGVEIRFTGSNFAVDDTFTFKVYPPQFMATSYKYTFTTGSGNITDIPSTTSTSVLGDLNSSSTLSTDDFAVSYTEPEHKELKVSTNLRIIKVVFNSTIDPTTINDKTIKIMAHPATGYDPNVTDIGKLNKFMLIDDNILYILLQGHE